MSRAQLLLYLALGPDEKLKYVEGGDRAVTRFEEGVKGLEAKAYRGLGVFQSQPYDQSDESQALQLLQRSTQVGEFYRMMPPETWSKEYILPPAYMDIIIFDEEADKHTHITFEQAIAACCLNKTTESDPLYWKKVMFGSKEKYSEYKTEMGKIANLKYYSSDKSAADSLAQKALTEWLNKDKDALTSEQEYDAVVKCVTSGVLMPVCIVIARPFIEHLTMSCIMAVSGSSTGATLFGPADSAPPNGRPKQTTPFPTRAFSLHPLHPPHPLPSLLSLLPFLTFPFPCDRRSAPHAVLQCKSRPTRLSRPLRVRRADAYCSDPPHRKPQTANCNLQTANCSRSCRASSHPSACFAGHYTCATTRSDANHTHKALGTLLPCRACSQASTMRRCHTKAVIHNNRNVLVMRDIMMAGYKAGGNCRWFGTPPTSNDAKNLKASDVQDGIQQRLQFVDDASGEYGSLMAFACPFKDEKTSARDQVISITDRLLPWEVGANSYPVKSYFPGGTAGYNAYRDQYGLNLIHYGEDVRSSENMDFMANGSTNNGLCFLGPHRRYNPWAQNFYELVPGQGHFGPDALPGVRAAPNLPFHLPPLPSPPTPPPPVSFLDGPVKTCTPGRALEARRVGVAQGVAKRNGWVRGGGALAACHAKGQHCGLSMSSKQCVCCLSCYRIGFDYCQWKRKVNAPPTRPTRPTPLTCSVVQLAANSLWRAGLPGSGRGGRGGRGGPSGPSGSCRTTPARSSCSSIGVA